MFVYMLGELALDRRREQESGQQQKDRSSHGVILERVRETREYGQVAPGL
jgi:hypothetical protein